MQVIQGEPLGTPNMNLYVRKCLKCRRYCYFYNDQCYPCNEDRL